jgi:hypothetical protein
MPLASSTDLVLSGVTDIQQAFLKPLPVFHLPPGHVYVLKLLTEVLISVTIQNLEIPSNPESTVPLRAGEYNPLLLPSKGMHHD